MRVGGRIDENEPEDVVNHGGLLVVHNVLVLFACVGLATSTRLVDQ